MSGSFLPSLWSSSNHSLPGARSQQCYAINWILRAAPAEYSVSWHFESITVRTYRPGPSRLRPFPPLGRST
jgi:hypothetical protein